MWKGFVTCDTFSVLKGWHFRPWNVTGVFLTHAGVFIETLNLFLKPDPVICRHVWHAQNFWKTLDSWFCGIERKDSQPKFKFSCSRFYFLSSRVMSVKNQWWLFRGIRYGDKIGSAGWTKHVIRSTIAHCGSHCMKSWKLRQSLSSDLRPSKGLLGVSCASESSVNFVDLWGGVLIYVKNRS